MSSTKQESIGLKEFISRVKQELLEDVDHEFRLFVIEKVEVEIAFTVERNASGGIDFKVVSIGTDRTITNAQTVKVVLEPIVTIEEAKSLLSTEEKNQAITKLLREFKPTVN